MTKVKAPVMDPIAEEAWSVYNRAKNQLADKNQFDFGDLDFSGVVDMGVFYSLRNQLLMLDSYDPEEEYQVARIEQEEIVYSRYDVLLISVRRLSGILYPMTEDVEWYRKTSIATREAKKRISTIHSGF